MYLARNGQGGGPAHSDALGPPGFSGRGPLLLERHRPLHLALLPGQRCQVALRGERVLVRGAEGRREARDDLLEEAARLGRLPLLLEQLRQVTLRAKRVLVRGAEGRRADLNDLVLEAARLVDLALALEQVR
uniref:Uncharacterized protein n=1 Tax=Alexandrium monilatum TaxID=311494 RepID=A0A7S4SQL1_9DINO